MTQRDKPYDPGLIPYANFSSHDLIINYLIMFPQLTLIRSFNQGKS